MALLEVLTRNERKLFDSPPQFLSSQDRKNYFNLDEPLNQLVTNLRGTTNKAGFILQLGYFRATGRFYLSKDFHKKDLNFIIRQFCLPADVNMAHYSSSSHHRHQELILEYLGYSKFNSEIFAQEITRLANKYIRPKQMLIAISATLKLLKMEFPSYTVFAEAITVEYDKIENIILEKIETLLTKQQINKITTILSKNNAEDPEKSAYKRSVLTGLRNVKQSLKPKDIKFNIQNFIKIKALYSEFKPVLENLALSKEAIHYYAIWVFKARTAQIAQFSNVYKRALYIISFIAYQQSFTQDILVDILLRSTQATLNYIVQLQKNDDFDRRETRNCSIKLLAECSKKSRNVLGEIKKIVFTPILTDHGKVEKIKKLINEDQQEFDTLYAGQFDKLEREATAAIHGQDRFDFMEKQSIKLQLRVSDIIKQLIFNPSNSDQHIMAAITYYKKVDGKIDNKAPIEFINKAAIEYLYDSKGNLKVSLYKSLLFINVAEAIKSGNLNLTYSYRYLSIDEYLINKNRWKDEKISLLERAGMTNLLKFKDILNNYKEVINTKFDSTNQKILSNKNPYIKFKEDGSFVVKTPGVDKLEVEKMSTLFESNQLTPIIQVLESINAATGFIDCFKHYTIKYSKKKPPPNVFFAGIIALGCNLGIRRMANISIGINEATLINACTWYFNIDNIHAANNQIISLINKLSLPNLFIRQKHLLHASGDGKKLTVNADSLNANYSFKYSGNAQGASIYTFIDERQVLFHSLVISSAEREAGYVIDGLLYNEEIKADIFSSDTHGFSEIVFAVTELLGISFAPRIRKSQEQYLYSFKEKSTYQQKGYKILPHKRINEKMINNSWDDILRLMVTIKLKEATASQIFKRLSSYAKEHPLYKALKEFGRIAKTGFLLTYFDNVTLRQMIQKQLNKVELANKFSSAVFFANNQEFSQTAKEDQEIATSCKCLIQNAIILWNYLFLSKILAECEDPAVKDEIIGIIISGSILSWGHFNLHGEYDFSEKSANDDSYFFNLDKILEFKVA